MITCRQNIISQNQELPLSAIHKGPFFLFSVVFLPSLDVAQTDFIILIYRHSFHVEKHQHPAQSLPGERENLMTGNWNITTAPHCAPIPAQK